MICYNTKDGYITTSLSIFRKHAKWFINHLLRRSQARFTVMYIYSLGKVILGWHWEAEWNLPAENSSQWAMNSPFYFSSLSLVSSRNGVRKDRCQLCGFTTPDGRIRETFGCVVLSWSESSTRLLVVVCRTDVLRSVFGSASGCQKTSKEVVRQDIIQIILKGPWHLEFTLSLSGWNRPKRRNCCWISNSNSWAWSRHWTK